MKVGTDICSVVRITEVYEKYGQRFLERILTEREQAYVQSAPKHLISRLAGRFAAKEAASKTLGTGWHGVGWKDVEIVRHPSGAPEIQLHGRAVDVAARRGLTRFEVSISHEQDYAVAFVVAYGD